VVRGYKIIKKEHSATFKSPLKFPESQYIMEYFPIKDGSRQSIFSQEKPQDGVNVKFDEI